MSVRRQARAARPGTDWSSSRQPGDEPWVQHRLSVARPGGGRRLRQAAGNRFSPSLDESLAEDLHTPLAKYAAGAWSLLPRFHNTPYQDARTAWRGATRNAQIEAGQRLREHAQILDEGVFIVDDYVKSADVGEGARVDEWRTEQQRVPQVPPSTATAAIDPNIGRSRLRPRSAPDGCRDTASLPSAMPAARAVQPALAIQLEVLRRRSRRGSAMNLSNDRREFANASSAAMWINRAAAETALARLPSGVGIQMRRDCI